MRTHEQEQEGAGSSLLPPQRPVEATSRQASRGLVTRTSLTMSTQASEGADSTTKEQREASRWAKSEAYFFNQGANIAFLGLLMAANTCMAVWGAWEFTEPHWTTQSDVLRVTLPIARAAGRLVTWNSALILVSGCKYLWSLVRLTPIQLGFPVDKVMPYYHRIIAVTIILMGCVVHSIPQIVNYATEEIAINDGGPIWTWGDGFATRQLLITGSILFVVFIAFYVTTLERVRHTTLGFRLFWMTHIVGIIMALPLLLIHGTIRGEPITLYFMAFPICLYGVDCVLRRYVFATLDANVVHLSTHDDDGEQVVKMVIQNKNFRYGPGQYAELKIPQISRYEWHPFTIASAPNENGHIVFYIKSVGKWTSALFDMVASHKSETEPAIQKIGLRGPYGAPAQNYLAYRHIVAIGSGIGVTPLLSVWNHLVSAGSSLVSDPDATQYRASTKYHERLPDDLDEKRLVEDANIKHLDVVSFADQSLTSARARAAYYASVLESMTVNICLFLFFLYMEVAVFAVWIFNHDVESATMEAVASGIALFMFGSKILLSLIAYGGRYLFSFVCFLESGIVIVDIVTLVASIGSARSPTHKEAIVYFVSFAFFLLLHGVRIFYVFYATARPPNNSEIEETQQGGTSLDSITGIWVSRHYSGMSYAAPDLVDTVRDVSPAFSLKLYATRDKPSGVEQANPFVDCGPNHSLQAGRPEWESILVNAIERAHSTNSEGESVGIFFCGSPAIASTLQRIARRVTAEHQYATRKEHSTGCSCRLLVHKENF